MPVLERISERRFSTAGLFVLVAVLVVVGSAWAGEYHVYSCRTPSGEAAPADGWSGFVAPGSAANDVAKNTCGEGGALVAALGEETIHAADVDKATWELSIPTTEKAVALRLSRAGYLHGRASEETTYEFWLSAPKQPNIFDECVFTVGCSEKGDIVSPLAPNNELLVPTSDLGAHVYMNVSCLAGSQGDQCQNGFGDPNGYAAAVYLYAADLTLEQQAGPSTSDVGGELANAPEVSGTRDVTFNATDPGAGVYEAVFTVDGQVVQSTVIDEEGGRCKNVGQTTDGLPAFLYLQPCPASVSADVGFDTTKVSDGSHHLVVSVIDPAGNSAPLLDRQITVDNPGVPGPPNGTNASSPATLEVGWKSSKDRRLTSRFGRQQEVVGRLTASDGQPIAGAQVGLQAIPAYAGAAPVTMPTLITAPDGTFALRLPGGLSSRTLRFTYCSHLDETQPAATSTLALVVHAGIALAVTPHVTSVGRTIRFSGRLLAGPVPHEGKQLVLEARSPGGPWLEFDVVRSGVRGRFRAGYRFKFPGPAKYQFRVLSEPESDYPFAAGASNVVVVRER
ncbi:MAG TPA: hypothetical protein VN892_00485 [Solirubrobacteraceae bacterium]|nr:hypothetical protein [Solirubrobacteraceae bacterium]